MTTTLQKHGDASALILDQALLDALGITPDTPLQITIIGNSLTVTPVRAGVSEAEIERVFDGLLPRYDGMLKKLAE